jgi:hypothetical protein
MKTILIILGILAVGAAVYFYFYKTGKINDRDPPLRIYYPSDDI